MRHALVFSFLALAACSSSSSSPDDGTGAGAGGGSAGTAATGGSAGTGGTSSTGGAGGTASAGTGGAAGAGGSGTAGSGTAGSGTAGSGTAGSGTAGAGGGGATLNGCSDADYVDGSADAFDRTVAFGGAVGLKYVPKCLTVKAGQMVTFSGSFAAHPLGPGSSPSMSGTGSPGNPITMTSSGMSQAFTFSAAGDFAYNCAFHYGSGMVGVVRVK